MDFELSEEQKMFKQSISDFLEREVPRGYTRECEEKDEYPYAIWEKLAKAGYCGILVPEEYGGSGGNVTDVCLFFEELSRKCLPASGLYLMGIIFPATVLNAIGNEEQKREYLPKIASGEVRFCLSITEPSGGTDILTLSTYADEDADGFIINGEKVFTSIADDAHNIFLLARTKKLTEVSKRSEGISLFIVPRDSTGITMRKLEMIGYRYAHTYQVFYNDVRIPKKNLLGEKDQGWYYATNILNIERICIPIMELGQQQAAFDYVLDYAKQRCAFGKPIAQFQVIQHYLANMHIAIETNRLWAYKLAWMADQGKMYAIEAMMAKVISANASSYIGRKGMAIMAGHGAAKDNEMEQYYRNFSLSPGLTLEMCRNYIGQYDLGLPRSY